MKGHKKSLSEWKSQYVSDKKRYATAMKEAKAGRNTQTGTYRGKPLGELGYSGMLYRESKKGYARAKGWVNESARHSMASYGISSGRKRQLRVATYKVPKNIKKQYSEIVSKHPEKYLEGENSTFHQAILEGELSKKWIRAKDKVAKDKLVFAKLDSVLEEIADDTDDKVINEKLNEVKREIKANGKLDFMEMDGRTMAFSILSDAQESLPYSKKNAVLFINQAKDLLKGNYKKEGHEVIFSNGESAIF